MTMSTTTTRDAMLYAREILALGEGNAHREACRRIDKALSDDDGGFSSPFTATFQKRVATWVVEVLGAEAANDMQERGDRLLEEVLELLQAHGYDAARVSALCNYVYGRPVGEPVQEAGGVMVTLAAFCRAAAIDMQAAGEQELERINRPDLRDRIVAKQATKPREFGQHVSSPSLVDSSEALLKMFLDRQVQKGLDGEAQRVHDDLRAAIENAKQVEAAAIAAGPDASEPTAAVTPDDLSIRTLPAQARRVETGPVRFGDDWPGYFIRGDNAFGEAMTIASCVHQGDRDPHQAWPIVRMVLANTYQGLGSCVLTGLPALPDAPDHIRRSVVPMPG